MTRLLGGLGNQLFQYAIGRSLALRHGTQLRLDTGYFANQQLRSFRLRHLNMDAVELSDAERHTLRLSAPSGGLAGLWARYFGRSTLTRVDERSFAFDASVLNSPANSYLVGYWQSPKYFESIEDTIRAEARPRVPQSPADADVAGQIGAMLSVAVHVRRGDYVRNPETSRYHGVCGLEYYMSAERYLLERVGPCRLFVFSDDPAWVSQNVRFRSPTTLVDHNDASRDYADLQLMSLCRHHIIANSTFSWWGAWLCVNPDKVIIAPKQWFGEGAHSTRDLIPESWVRL